MKVSERLVVAVDFEVGSYDKKEKSKQVLDFVKTLQGTGCVIKLNSILGAVGYNLIEKIHDLDFKVFADLKLFDISQTLSLYGKNLQKFEPDFLTVSCLAGVSGMEVLRKELAKTEIFGVTILTSLGDGDTKEIFRCDTSTATLRLAELSVRAKVGGLILAPKDILMIRKAFGNKLSLNTPGIRLSRTTVANDDQNHERVLTPKEAIEAGADRIIIGRPILSASKPYDVVMKIIEEISTTLSKK